LKSKILTQYFLTSLGDNFSKLTHFGIDESSRNLSHVAKSQELSTDCCTRSPVLPPRFGNGPIAYNVDGLALFYTATADTDRRPGRQGDGPVQLSHWATLHGYNKTTERFTSIYSYICGQIISKQQKRYDERICNQSISTTKVFFFKLNFTQKCVQILLTELVLRAAFFDQSFSFYSFFFLNESGQHDIFCHFVSLFPLVRTNLFRN
jgi:hypothetical protein